MKDFYAIKTPAGYLSGICEVTGKAESTKTLANAEWFKGADLARATARFLIGKRCASTSGVYPFKFNAARVCQ